MKLLLSSWRSGGSGHAIHRSSIPTHPRINILDVQLHSPERIGPIKTGSARDLFRGFIITLYRANCYPVGVFVSFPPPSLTSFNPDTAVTVVCGKKQGKSLLVSNAMDAIRSYPTVVNRPAQPQPMLHCFRTCIPTIPYLPLALLNKLAFFYPEHSAEWSPLHKNSTY